MKQQTIPYMTKTDIASKLASEQKERDAQGRPAPRRFLDMPPKSKKFHRLPNLPSEQNRLADACLDFVVRFNPTTIDQYPESMGYSPYQFKQIAKTNPYFAEVLELAMYMIGTVLEDEWRYFECKDSYAKTTLPLLNKDYAADREAMIQKVTDKIKNYEYHSFRNDIPKEIEDGREKDLLEVQATTISDTSNRRTDK